MTIFFPDEWHLNPLNTCLEFRAEVDGVRRMCEISSEALSDHFGAANHRNAELLAAFERGRTVIYEVARARLIADPTGRCLLISAHF